MQSRDDGCFFGVGALWWFVEMSEFVIGGVSSPSLSPLHVLNLGFITVTGPVATHAFIVTFSGPRIGSAGTW